MDHRGRRPGRRAKVLIAEFVIVLIIPLGAASWQTWRYEHWMGATETAAQEWLSGTSWELKSVQQEGSDIVISAVGPGDPPPIDALRTAVRGDVPARVDVLVVEESGRTTQLSLALDCTRLRPRPGGIA